MGYRSTVRLSTTEEGYGKLVSALWRQNGLSGVEYPLVGVGWDGRRRSFDYTSHEDNGAIVGFDGVKWYDGYPEIDAFEDALRELDETGVPFCFLRLGEDYDDVEFRTTDNAYDVDMPRVYPEASWGWC